MSTRRYTWILVSILVLSTTAAQGQLNYTFQYSGYHQIPEFDTDWVDMANAISLLPQADGDTMTGIIPIGFPFYYFGQTFQTVQITHTGRIYFGQRHPGVDEMCILPFGDSLIVDTLGYLKTKVIQRPGGRVFVCEFMSSTGIC